MATPLAAGARAASESDDESHREYGTRDAAGPGHGGAQRGAARWGRPAALVACVATMGVLAVMTSRRTGGALDGTLSRNQMLDVAMETMPKRQPFSFFDHDGNQKVDLQEMNMALIEDLQYDLTYHQVAQLFRETDLNSDGVIDVDEAAEGVVRPGLRQRTEFSAAERHAHHQPFEFFDHDGDGKIKLQELAYALIEDLRYDLTYAQVADLFRLTDTNDDGFITTLEKDDKPQPKPPRPAETEPEAEAEAEEGAPEEEEEEEEGESLDFEPAAPEAEAEAEAEAGGALEADVEEVEEELEAEGESLNSLSADEKAQFEAEDLARVAEAARVAQGEADQIAEEEETLEEAQGEADTAAVEAAEALLAEEEQALADVAEAADALLAEAAPQEVAVDDEAAAGQA